MARVRGGRAIAAAVALSALACVPATAAHAAQPGAVAMFSDPGDFIGQGQQRLFTTRNGTVVARHYPRRVTVDVSGGTSGDSFGFVFDAPDGRKLKKGVYDYAQRSPFQSGGRAGIDISGDGRGCNTETGRFQVRDISVDGDKVRRLWIVYEQHCEGGVPATFGEVRIGHIHAALPTLVRWPEGEGGQGSTPVPVTFAPATPLHVARTSITGRNHGAFQVRADECRGRTVSRSSPCQVWVRHQAGAGTHRASLRIRSASGRHYGAQLQGFNWGGRTRLVMHSDIDDYIGQGPRDWSYTKRNARFYIFGGRTHVEFYVAGQGDDYWDGAFSAPPGDILAAGTTYEHAKRDPFRGSSPGMEVTATGRGCNEIDGRFKVTAARFDSSGAVHNFGIRFDQRCDRALGQLHGTFEFRVGDHTKPPPWMRPLGG